MALASTRPASQTSPARAKHAGRPFLGLIDSVIVADGEFQFDGAIFRDDAVAAWLWMARDLSSDLIDLSTLDDNPRAVEAVESLIPELLARARKALTEAESSVEVTRRIMTQMGGEGAWHRLPVVLNALRCRGLLDKAQGFGRAANGMADEAALALALQAMPLSDKPVAALLMQATVGHVAAPARLITAAIRIAGSNEESALMRSGFGPMVEAMLAHAQDQIPKLSHAGTFGDMDLVCRAVDRFHRLVRAVSGYVELSRSGRWSTVIAALTKAVSARLDPKLRDVAPDLNKALRKRDGVDRLDADQQLAALNGIYLLAAVRDARDSLALNALFDQVWSQTGQALEIHIERNLDQLRQNPTDRITSARLDTAIKMAEVRFNQDYADVLRRAKDVVERRT